MYIHCPTCNADIPADAINMQQMVAKCATCNTVFDIRAQTDGFKPSPVLDVPLPKGITLAHDGTDLVITRRWLGFKHFFLIFFCLVWNGFLAVWFGIAIASHIWIMAAFGSLHAMIGIFLTYYTIAGFFNHTTFRVSMSRLAIRHGPVPWWGNRTLEASSIGQVFCKQSIRRSDGTTSVSYSVFAATRDGRDQKLADDLDDANQAMYLEQEIERYLGIKDVPVRGEMPK